MTVWVSTAKRRRPHPAPEPVPVAPWYRLWRWIHRRRST